MSRRDSHRLCPPPRSFRLLVSRLFVSEIPKKGQTLPFAYFEVSQSGFAARCILSVEGTEGCESRVEGESLNWSEGDLFEINKCTKPAEHFNQQDKQRVLAPGCCAGKHGNPIHQRLKPYEWDRFH